MQIDGAVMNLTMLLIAVLFAVLIAAVPAWPYSRAWGYVPSGVIAAILAILIAFSLLAPA